MYGWCKAIDLEQHNAIKKHEGSIRDLIENTKITGHMVFDVKLGENSDEKLGSM